jgi:predicted phosphodiesterase
VTSQRTFTPKALAGLTPVAPRPIPGWMSATLEPVAERPIAATTPPLQRSHRRRVALSALAAAWLAAAALVGVTVALRGWSAADYRLGPARVRIATSLSPRGSADVYIPLVDWGVRAHPSTAPVALSATVLSIDRGATLSTIRRPASAGARVAEAEADAPGVVRSALQRAALVALAGGLCGGLVGGLGLAAWLGRRRLVAAGGAAGIVVSGGLVVSCAVLFQSPDYAAFQKPTFYAHGGDLPKLLAFSDQLDAAGADYASSYQRALAGIDTLLSAAAGAPAPADTQSFLVGSDIHSNWLTLPAFAGFADHRPVFLIGDFTQQGTPIEATVAQRAARLGHPTVVVSGNHDTPQLMRTLAASGAIVLTHRGRLDARGHVHGPPVQSIAGLLVAGYEDPLEAQAGSFGHRLDFTPTELAAQERAVERWFDGLLPRPQIVLVHDFRIAAAIRAHAAAEAQLPLIILTGHDHKQHVDQTGLVVEVDGGSLGAGGVFDIGKAAAGFAQVHLTAQGWPQTVDMIAADPITGESSARRVTLAEDVHADASTAAGADLTTR